MSCHPEFLRDLALLASASKFFLLLGKGVPVMIAISIECQILAETRPSRGSY